MCTLCIRIFVFLSCLCPQVYSSHTHHVVCRYWHIMYTGDMTIIFVPVTPCDSVTAWQRDSVTACYRAKHRNLTSSRSSPTPHHDQSWLLHHHCCPLDTDLGPFQISMSTWVINAVVRRGGRRVKTNGAPMAPYYWIESRNRNMMMGEHLAHHFPNLLATYLIFWSGSRSGSV